MVLMARLRAVKKGPAWERRVELVNELFDDMLTELRQVTAENNTLRRALGRRSKI
jgi:hypothetical protein